MVNDVLAYGSFAERSSVMFTRLEIRLVAGVLLMLAGFSTACKTSPQAREAKYLKRGADYLRKKDFGRALLEFQNAAAQMPKDDVCFWELPGEVHHVLKLRMKDPGVKRQIQLH